MSRSSPAPPSPAPAVAPLLVAAPLADWPLLGALFAGVSATVVALETLRVSVPWRGELFELLGAAAAARPAHDVPVGLVVPVRWLAGEPAPEIVIVSDQVNTRLRGPQPFPALTGVYQPATIRRAVGRRVYSVVAVAGVANVADLTPFERQAVAQTGCPAVCDCLADVAIIAALHGLKVSACGVPSSRQPPTGRSL